MLMCHFCVCVCCVCLCPRVNCLEFKRYIIYASLFFWIFSRYLQTLGGAFSLLCDILFQICISGTYSLSTEIFTCINKLCLSTSIFLFYLKKFLFVNKKKQLLCTIEFITLLRIFAFKTSQLYAAIS